MPEPGQIDTRESQVDRHAEIMTRVDALAEGGVGSLGLIAISDLAEFYRASSGFEVRRYVLKSKPQDYLADQIALNQAERQIELHRVTIPGYEAAYLSAHQLAKKLQDDYVSRHLDSSKRGKGYISDHEIGVMAEGQHNVTMLLSGAVNKSLRR